MHPARQREFWNAVLAVGAALALGWLLGRPFLVAALALALILAIQLRHLFRMHRWLLGPDDQNVPEAGGLWGDVFNEIHLMMKQVRASKGQLQDALARFQEAAAALPDGMVLLVGDDRIEWLNPVAQELLGITFPGDRGRRIVNLVRAPDFTVYLNAGNYTEPIEMESPAIAGRRLSISLVPYGIQRKLLICRDITHIERLERMRRNFVANVSHELRSPITVLSGYLETLRGMDHYDREQLRQAFVTMHGQAQRMERLVVDLLALSRLETAPLQHSDRVIDVPAMLPALVESAVLLSGENHHSITLEAEPGLQLRGDEDELRSVFSNLLNNAVRYTPARGRIVVGWRRHGREAEFSVRDNGVGIAPQHIPHLTERFYRVDVDRSRETGGTGLGLAIVKHALNRHGAHLDVDSTPGRGSTFSCRFPAERVVLRTTSAAAES